MQQYTFKKPPFIEELVFRMKPECVEGFIRVAKEHWLPGLSKQKGFLGGELWVGEKDTGEIAEYYFWESYEDFASLDQEWLSDMKRRAGALTQGYGIALIPAFSKGKKFKACEFR
jgi:uncharacterized protein (TIGR03792 family)